MDNSFIPPPPTALSAERPLQPPKPPAEEISAGKGVKETIESILIAFILAFVFRAFVVEAFVIPTGSMATTLMGAHMRFTCKECGYEFEAGYSTPDGSNGEEIDIPSRAVYEEGDYDDKGRAIMDPATGKQRTHFVDRSFDVYCQNCRHKVSKQEATGAPVRYGDRILVLKYLYIPWISTPHRWDVVVFKTPTSSGKAPLYTINYIKRLVGLPGETLMILDGDVYVLNEKNANKKFWEIQTKPKYAQDALWRVIYDHDYRPLENNRTDGWRLPWVHNAGDGWDTGDSQKSRVITFNNPSGTGQLRFDRTAAPNYKPEIAPGGYFTDWLAYDATMFQFGNAYGKGVDNPLYTISDLKLSFSYERKKGDGALKASLTKHDHEFVLEMLPDRLRLIHRPPGSAQGVEIKPLKAFNPSAISGPIRVDFANVDYQVSVRINDELAFETTPTEYKPNVDDLRLRYFDRTQSAFAPPSVKLDASNQEARLSHVSLWRDVYYTPEGSSRQLVPHARPDRPMVLKKEPGEFFVMGDNSAASSDARYWPESVDLPEEDVLAQPGCVPARFMLGRAFFVYWPAGYRPINSAPALVPDFGDMRLIH